MNYSYNEIIDILTRSTVTITFEKVDGTMRTMNCTLLPQYLPESYRDNKPMLTEQAPATIAVWDIGSSGWRSFRVDSVKDIVANGC